MMHELFMNVAYACGMAVAVAAAVVAVKFSFGYVVKRKERTGYPTEPKAYAAPSEKVREILASAGSSRELDPQNKRIRVGLKLPEPPPEPEPEAEPEIECGNCGALINTEPVGGEAKAGNVFVEIYECGNCGAKVEI